MTPDERKDNEELLALLDERERRAQLARVPETHAMTRDDANAFYRDVAALDNQPAERELCKTDLFYLLTVAFKRRDVDRDWLYDRCREVQSSPDGHLDLWAREHYKSTLITYAKSIQDILCDPEITIGIFSHTRPIAKAFLEQIKREFETNEWLKALFPDVLYARPASESPRWSFEDEPAAE